MNPSTFIEHLAASVTHYPAGAAAARMAADGVSGAFPAPACAAGALERHASLVATMKAARQTVSARWRWVSPGVAGIEDTTNAPWSAARVARAGKDRTRYRAEGQGRGEAGDRCIL